MSSGSGGTDDMGEALEEIGKSCCFGIRAIFRQTLK